MFGEGHGHTKAPYTIPDYKIYKVEEIPLLMKTKQALQAHNLRDPWLRNEVWRYRCEEFGTERIRAKRLFLRGAKLGGTAFLLTIGGTYVYDALFASGNGHKHLHHHHREGGTKRNGH